MSALYRFDEEERFRGSRKPRAVAGTDAGVGEDSSPDEMYDEVDQFHRRRDLPHLDDGAEADDSSGNEVCAVSGLK